MPAGSFAVSVKPTVLKWARETSGYSLPEVAQRCRKPEPEVAAWETGKQRPTWAGLRRLAKIYRRPVVSLLLPAPPKEEPVPPDFRTLPKASKTLSPKTLFAIRTARWLAHTATDLEEQLGIQAVPEIHEVHNIIRGA